MGLTADLAATRLHVLPVAVPGRPLLHLHARAAVRARGWVLAASPADADVLLVCGAADGELAEAVDRVWQQVPAPRARRRVTEEAEIADALDSAARVVGDVAAQREALRSTPQPGDPEPAHRHDEHEQHGEQEHDGGTDHHEDHEGMEHDGHGGMDHGGMSMDGPAGIPLASGWEGDRDGLEMDVLAFRLGPVLPDWPAGLVVDCTLSGDVVASASARLLPGDAEEEPREAGGFVQAVERAARLLRLAGWTPPALRLERAIDAALAGAPGADGARVVRAVAHRVARSALLAWSLRGTAVDVRARLLVILGDAERAALGEPPVDAPLDPDALAASLSGRTLTVAGLVVAAAGAVQAVARA
ncbi:hypothetical protein [Amnibacterium endophyticum]|uniref:Uncharacterized protein n=1 Tax=Amnibacterium endophyticum TaxID=2109337 RepID=A0ABW4LHT8_9MICO